MNAPQLVDYDLNQLEYEDNEVDPSDWNLSSALNPNLTYRLISKESIEYFDYTNRYIIKGN